MVDEEIPPFYIKHFEYPENCLKFYNDSLTRLFYLLAAGKLKFVCPWFSRSCSLASPHRAAHSLN